MNNFLTSLYVQSICRVKKNKNELYSEVWLTESSPRMQWLQGTRHQGWYIRRALRKQFPNLAVHFILSLSISRHSQALSSLALVEVDGEVLRLVRVGHAAGEQAHRRQDQRRAELLQPGAGSPLRIRVHVAGLPVLSERGHFCNESTPGLHIRSG